MSHKNEFLLTKIIATLGPASESVETILQLIEEGARAFRINFSHGAFEEHERILNNVRRAGEQSGVPVAVIGDLSGPKIRIGKVAEGGVRLAAGMAVAFQKEPVVAGEPAGDSPAELVFSTTYPRLVEEVKPGQQVLLDDGSVRLVCLDKTGKGGKAKLICEARNGGLITSGKGINLPDTNLSLPALTEKDQRCIRFAVEKGFDFLAQSFVRNGEDVRLLKDRLRDLGVRPTRPRSPKERDQQFAIISREFREFIPVISKIEKPQAVANLEEIIAETDAVMVARGDLGVEMDLAEVAVLQKRIIGLCHDYGMPVIVATQMLQSMIEAPVPTRAEVSDVANAIFDGVDAVMLSGETAVGKWPVEAVRMMNRIAGKTNQYLRSRAVDSSSPRKLQALKHRTPALAHGVKTIVRDIDARLMAVWSSMGGAAIFLSQQRMPRPIIAFSANPEILRRMALLYALTPVFMEQPASTAEFLKQVDELLLEKKWASRNDPIVLVLAQPIQQTGIANEICIHYVGESL